MRHFISIALAAVLVSCAGDGALAQPLRTQPTDYPGCVYYSSFSPVLANNQASRLRCDTNGQLLISGAVTVDTTGLATSTNQGTQIELAITANTQLTAINTLLGLQADAACATDNGTCTLEALIKRLNQRLTTINTTLGTPFQAGGSIGNTTFAVTNVGTFATQAAITAASGSFASGSQPIGITPTDRTVTSATGASQTVMAALATRKGVLIMNTGNANCGINPTGGTAAIGGAGTVTLTPTGVYSPRIPTLSAITAICTAAQPLYAEEQ